MMLKTLLHFLKQLLEKWERFDLLGRLLDPCKWIYLQNSVQV